jgi:mono/diheme cytochrome c family protein
MFKSLAIPAFAAASLGVGLFAFAAADPAAISPGDALFRDKVAPIFEAHCVICHNADAHKGGHALDSAAGLAAGGPHGPILVPGKPDASKIIEMVSGPDPKMPKKGDPLTAAEVKTLRDWIAAGAPHPAEFTLTDKFKIGGDWWSLKPIVKAEPPKLAGDDAKWARTPIDAFVVAKLREKGLAPSPEADRRTLIRRLYFDLVGLPPAPEAVDAFVADADPKAYEKLVDTLLASPQYGERWARHWLDVVHYGDTSGYDKDKTRPNAWPYRDYVIRSLNDDKPYARFVQEQLAGDVLFPGSPDGIIGLGFIAAGPFDWVGHVEVPESKLDGKVCRNLDRDDMVMNTMSTFVSQTAHCARCHNHKFDPIVQEDYYSLQAVFAAVDRADRPFDADPASGAKRKLVADRRDALAQQRAALATKIDSLKSPELVALEARAADIHKAIASLPKPAGEAKDHTLGYHSAIEPKPDVTKWVQVDLGSSQPIEHLFLIGANVVYGKSKGPGFGFPIRFKIEASDDPRFAAGVTLIADHTAADYPNPGDAPVGFAVPRGTRARHLRVTGTKLYDRSDDFIMAISELVALSGGRNIAQNAAVTALDSIEAPPGWSAKYLTDGFFGVTGFSQLATNAPADSPSNGYHSGIEPKVDVTKWVQVDLGQAMPLERISLFPARPTDFRDAPGFGFPARYKVEASMDAQFTAPVVLADRTAADVANPGEQTVVIEPKAIVARYVRVTATKLWERTGDYVFALAEMQIESGGRNVADGAQVTALDSIEQGRWSTRNLVDGYNSRNRIAGAATNVLALFADRLKLDTELQQVHSRRTELLGRLVDQGTRDQLAVVERELAVAEASLSAAPQQGMVFAAASQFPAAGSHIATGGKPREIFVLRRGEITSPMQKAGPGTIAVADLPSRFNLPENATEGDRRAALANWITDRRNPLTWRSIVNRVWHYHFGHGIVDSPNDFGRMGQQPTHPQLLDWLAAEFRDGPQSIKALHRLIVTSAVYRQSSAGNAAMEKIDSSNQYLWRMNRRRLEAESLRDAVLAVSGKLDMKMYGPGFFLFGFIDDHSPHYLYEKHDPDDPASLRRSVYRFIVRSVPDPFMTTMDCPDPSLIAEKRNETVTALQSLSMLNNALMVRQAEHFAKRIEAMAPDAPGRIAAAFRLAFDRRPTDEEASLLAAYAQKNGLPNTCRLIYNMNEFIFID